MTEPLHGLIVEDRSTDAELMVLRLVDEGFDPTWVRVDLWATVTATGRWFGRPVPADVLLDAWGMR